MTVESLFVGAQVVTSDPPGLVDGQSVPLSVNSDQRLRVSTKPGAFATATGACTTIGSQVVADVTDASNVMVHIKNTGSAAMSAGVLQFEGSLDSTDGTDGTWFPIQAVSSNGNTISTSTPTLSIAVGAGYTYAWELSVNACRWFRVRTSTAVTTNAIAFVSIVRGSYATEPIPAIQSHGITGNVSVVSASSFNFGLTTSASTSLATVKSSSGSLFELTISNITPSTIYVKLYDKASSPVLASNVPIMTIPVDAGKFLPVEFGFMGKRFPTGIAIAVTGGAAPTDTTPVTAGAQINITYY